MSSTSAGPQGNGAIHFSEEGAGTDADEAMAPGDGTGEAGRRQVLLGAGAVALFGAAAGAAIAYRSLERPDPAAPQPAAEESEPTSANPSSPGDDDATETLQALLDRGDGRVAFPPGTNVVTATLVVPPSVTRLDLPRGSVLHVRGDVIGLRRSGEVEATARRVLEAEEGSTRVVLDADGLAEGDWLYVCSDDWVKVGKSKAGTMRRVVSASRDAVEVDKPLYRTYVENPRAHRVVLAPPLEITGGGAIENGDPRGTFSNLVRLDFVRDPVVRGIELRDCGTAALRTFATVGGLVDCWIHDCVDDQGAGHYGYGVSATSATRGLEVLGRIERVRHAFTTDHGYDPPLASIALTGEPEDLYVAPVVRRTTSTGIDTHEPGYGITIVPDVRDCGTEKWGGVNIRARGVVLRGGTVADSRDWGVLVSPSAAGTVIEDVAVTGVREGRGIHCKAATTILGGTVSGFAQAIGLAVDEGVAVRMEGTTIDGLGEQKARGIHLAGTGSALSGRVVGCGIGVLHAPGSEDNVVDLDYVDVARDEVEA